MSEMFSITQNAKDEIEDYNPSREHSIKVTHLISEKMIPLQNAYDILKRQRKQFVPKLWKKKKKLSTRENLQPSTLSSPEVNICRHSLLMGLLCLVQLRWHIWYFVDFRKSIVWMHPQCLCYHSSLFHWKLPLHKGGSISTVSTQSKLFSIFPI